MRVLTLAILTILTIGAAGPVRAQTYNPNYPVCLHVYDLGANEYAYTLLAPCAMSASPTSETALTEISARPD